MSLQVLGELLEVQQPIVVDVTLEDYLWTGGRGRLSILERGVQTGEGWMDGGGRDGGGRFRQMKSCWEWRRHGSDSGQWSEGERRVQQIHK